MVSEIYGQVQLASDIVQVVMDAIGEEALSLSNMIVLGQLGRGGTSHVFRAQSTRSKRLYAMKVIDKKAPKYHRDALEKELAIHCRLSHPSVVRLQGHIEDSDNHYVLTEYCEGGEMTRLLAQPLSEEILAGIVWQVAVGLSYLHEQKVAHCDIKLSNLLLQQGHIKICDFGFSHTISQSDPTERPVCGTIHYMAPEILKEKKRIYCKQSDVWALGICMLILITKKQPYSGESFQQLRRQIITGQRQKLPKMSSELQSLMNKLLEKKPEARISIQQVLAHPFLAKYSTHLSNPIIITINISKQPKIGKVQQVTSLPSQNEAEESGQTQLKTIKQDARQYGFKRVSKQKQHGHDDTLQRRAIKSVMSDNEKTVRQIKRKMQQDASRPLIGKICQNDELSSYNSVFDARLIKPFQEFHYQTKNDGFINIAVNGLISIKVKNITFQISPDGQTLSLSSKKYILKDIQENPSYKQPLQLYSYAKDVINLLKKKQYAATWRQKYQKMDLLFGISLDWKEIKCICWSKGLPQLLEWTKDESWILLRTQGENSVKKQISQLSQETEIFSIMKGHLCPSEKQEF